jgi:branched-chain amino acid transport system substrate-binding protein
MRNYLKYAVVLVLAVALLALGGISCSSGGGGGATPTPSATPKEAYQVGAIFALSGFNQPLGEPQKPTVEMMVDQINAAGGINGHKLEVTIYNNESDKVKAATLADKLIEQGVLAIIGPTGSGDSMAAKVETAKAQVPLISCAAASVIVEPAGNNTWTFNTPQLDFVAVERVYTYLKEGNLTKVALICDTAAFGDAGRNWLIKQAELDKYGLTIAGGVGGDGDQRYGTYDVNMQAQLTNIKRTGAQAIVCWGTNPGPAIIARDMNTLKMDIPLICSHGIAFKEFIDIAGTAANGVIFPAGKLPIVDYLPDTDIQKALLEKYKADFEAKYGIGKANTFGGHAYDALSMVVKALGNMSEGLSTAEARAFIRDYIENDIKGFVGTGGVFNMSPQDHNGLPRDPKEGMILVKIVDQQWTWLQD